MLTTRLDYDRRCRHRHFANDRTHGAQHARRIDFAPHEAGRRTVGHGVQQRKASLRVQRLVFPCVSKGVEARAQSSLGREHDGLCTHRRQAMLRNGGTAIPRGRVPCGAGGGEY